MKVVVLLSVLAFGCATPAACRPHPLTTHAHHLLNSGLHLENAKVDAGDAQPGSIPVGDFNDEALGPIQKKFDERVEAGDTQIYFRIDSNGGAVDPGMDLINHIKDAKQRYGLKVNCQVEYKAYSMGFIFLQAVCDSRIAASDAMLMTHSVAGSVQHAHADGFADALADLEAHNAMAAAICAPRLGLTESAYRAKVDHNEWWMGAKAALKAHAVDSISDQFPLPYELDAPEDGLEALLKKLSGG